MDDENYRCTDTFVRGGPNLPLGTVLHRPDSGVIPAMRWVVLGYHKGDGKSILWIPGSAVHLSNMRNVDIDIHIDVHR